MKTRRHWLLGKKSFFLFSECLWVQLVFTLLLLFLNIDLDNSPHQEWGTSPLRLVYFYLFLPICILLLNSICLYLLAFPILFAKRAIAKKNKRILLIAIWLIWVGIACLRFPSLFSHYLIAKNTKLISFFTNFSSFNFASFTDLNILSIPFFYFCSYVGLFLLFLLLFFLLLYCWRILKIHSFIIFFHLIIIGSVLVIPSMRSYPSLPEGSLLLVIMDGWNSSSFMRGETPELEKISRSKNAKFLNHVIPTIEQSAPAMASFLTGLLPAESGVYGQFHMASEKLLEASIVKKFRAADYCTVVEGDFFYRKFDYGFEHVISPEIFYQERHHFKNLYTSNFFLLATLSWASLRSMLPTNFSNRVFSNRIFEDPKGRLYQFWRDIAERCKGKKIFALIHLEIPHYESAQIWPYYLSLSFEERGLYSVQFSSKRKRNTFERARDAKLYYNSLRQADDIVSTWLSKLEEKNFLEKSSVIITADHGNYVEEKENAFFGYKLGSIEEGGAPLLWIGQQAKSLSLPSEKPVSSIHLAKEVQKAYFLTSPNFEPYFPLNIISSETTDWVDGKSPEIDFGLLNYDVREPNFLFISPQNGDLYINLDKIETLNYFRQRRWIIDGQEYMILPVKPRVFRILKNKTPISFSQLPNEIKKYLQEFYPKLYSDIIKFKG